jgi:hypothetical protein
MQKEFPSLEELKQYELPDLLDLLVKETEIYTRLHSEKGYTPELDWQRDRIKMVQFTIGYKKQRLERSGSPS